MNCRCGKKILILAERGSLIVYECPDCHRVAISTLDLPPDWYVPEDTLMWKEVKNDK